MAGPVAGLPRCVQSSNPSVSARGNSPGSPNRGCSVLQGAAALSPSATTRLVNRLEERALLTRVLCDDDRRGLSTELTHAGQALVDEAAPLHAAALEEALSEARDVPELEELAAAVERLEGASV